MNPLYDLVARRAGHRCEYCRAPQGVSGSVFHVEHVVPQSAGGSDDPPNLALACPSCNQFKGDARTARAEVSGLTPTGRATVTRLDVNNPQQMVARALWIRYGLYR